MNPRTFVLFIVVLLLNNIRLSADVPGKGRPFTQYFSPREYRAGSNTFNVVRDSLGVFYFSNDEGVLLYDGSEWNLIPITDNKPVYWVEIDHDGTVLIASTGEVGYLDHLSNGKKVYRQLIASNPEVPFENVWEIAVTSKGSYFRSKKLLISYRDKEITKITADGSNFDVALTVRDTARVRVYGKGFYNIIDDQLVAVPGGEYFAAVKLNSYLPYEDNKILIGTRHDGLYILGDGTVTPFKTEADEFLRKYRIYDGCITQSGNYAYAAYIRGVAIIDKDGKLLQVLDEDVGLPQYQYLYVGASDPSSLWMTHAVGASRAETLSPISYLDGSFGIQDVITEIKIYNDNLIITTLKGFYQYDETSRQFVKVNTDYLDEFHGITKIKEKVFVGGHLGLMSFEPYGLKRYTTKMIHELNVSVDHDFFLAGSGEGGFDVIYNDGKDYSISTTEGFNEQVKRILPFKNEAILVTHFGNLVFIELQRNNGGILPVLSKQYKLGNFDALKTGENFLITTPNDWKLCSASGDTLNSGPLPTANRISKIQITSDLKSDFFWVCYEDDQRVDYCEKWIFKNSQVSSTSNKFKSGFKINSIHLGEDGIDWFAGDEGIIRYDNHMLTNNQSSPVICHISSVYIGNDSLISQYGVRPEIVTIPYNNTSLLFNYYSDRSFTSNDEILFQYKLIGLDAEWSAWTKHHQKEYTTLKPGDYEFQVRAKNGLGIVSRIEPFGFAVQTPWYRSTLSYVGYMLFGVLSLYGAVQWRTRNLKKSKKRLEKLVQGRTIEVELQKQSLEEQRETLRKANTTKDQLFSIIGHDLRGPLNSIQGLTDLIQHYRQEKEPEKVDELMGHMSDSVKRLSHLLDNLLSWALNQSGNFNLKKETIKLHYLVNEVVGVLRETASSKNIEIQTVVASELTLNADSNSIGTILRNLLSNAIKFTHENGKIWINASAKDKILTIEVGDNGVGIAKDKLADVFQLANTSYGTSNEKGTGLGLVLVDDFVKLNGGKMTVESDVDQGTKFFLSFPLNGSV